MTFPFPCVHTQANILQKYELSLISTSLDISGDAWLILNTAQDTRRVSALMHGADRKASVTNTPNVIYSGAMVL